MKISGVLFCFFIGCNVDNIPTFDVTEIVAQAYKVLLAYGFTGCSCFCGEGMWQGETESSVMFKYLSVKADMERDRLKEALTELRIYFKQESILLLENEVQASFL